METEPSAAKEEASASVVYRKPRTEVRKPKKSKKTEEVDPIVLRKRMRQLYKAVVNYQVMWNKCQLYNLVSLSVAHLSLFHG